MGDTAAADSFAQAWRDNRSYLVDLAFRMLGDVGEAQDVVQEAFTRLSRTEPGEVQDARGWLTVVTSRLCLDQIRSARSRHETVHDVAAHDAAMSLSGAAAVDPADRVTLDDEVRAALLLVLERLGPAERVAFVLHDVFHTPFDEIAEALGRPVATCRQLARRARQKVAESPLRPHDTTDAQHRKVTETFIRACTNGDLEALLTVLHPNVWGSVDFGAESPIRPHINHGADDVARTLVRYWGAGSTMVAHPLRPRPVVLAYLGRTLFAVIELTVDGDLVTAIKVTGPATP
jgi:RNA polymerase sigma-70 factor (ECF subfamily)